MKWSCKELRISVRMSMTEEIPLKPARGGLPLPIDWEALKQAAIAGVDFRVLAIQFRLFDKHGKPNTNAIRQRAYRESWPIAARIVRVAKKNLKEAMQAAHKQGMTTPYPSPQNPTYNNNTDRRDTEREELEPGLSDLGFMGDSPNNQGIQLHGNGNQGSREAGIRGDSSGIRGFDDSQVPGFGDESVSRELRIGEGSEGSLSIGKVGNSGFGNGNGNLVPGNMRGMKGMDASDPLASSESTAATLIQAHMATLAQESILQALQRAHASIHAAPKQLPIATITDLRSAMKLAMEATGLDSKQGNQTLNILVSPTPKQGTWNFHDSPESLTIDAE